MKELEIYKGIVDIINYSERYILISIPKEYIYLKIRFTDNLYNLMDNVIRANVNEGSIRSKYQKEIIININLLDYYIEAIKRKEIITSKAFKAFIGKMNNLNKLTLGWFNSEKSR